MSQAASSTSAVTAVGWPNELPSSREFDALLDLNKWYT